MNDTQHLTPEPTLTKSLTDRLNAAWSEIAENRLMQEPRPFKVVGMLPESQGFRGDDVIALRVAPRDIEIMATILEEIARGSFAKPNFAPSVHQTSLPVG